MSDATKKQGAVNNYSRQRSLPDDGLLRWQTQADQMINSVERASQNLDRPPAKRIERVWNVLVRKGEGRASLCWMGSSDM